MKTLVKRASALRLFVLALMVGCAAPSGLQRIPAPAVRGDRLPGGARGDAGDRVEVRAEEGRYVFAPDGTKTFTYTLEYQVLAPDDLGEWATIRATWSPWFEAEPELRAEVTTPDGRTFDLDPSAVSRGPVKSERRGLNTDRRRVEAPLPGLVPGAVVRQTVIKRETRPLLEAGSWARYHFGMSARTARSTFVVDVPEGTPLTYQVRGLDLEPDVVRQGGRLRLTLEARDVPGYGPLRMHLPPDHPRYPHVAFTTAPSWARVARAYHARVQDRLRGADVAALVDGLDVARPPRAVAADLLARLHTEVRPTGVALGQQPIAPRPPGETLARRFGDAKDQAALLVALFDAAGIEAQVALLRAGLGEDVNPELPGIEPFDHAVVRVPGVEGDDLWIDPTEPLLPAGELPLTVQGRRALLIDDGGPGLVEVPEAPPEHNRYVEHREVIFPDWGSVDIVERTVAEGSLEHRLRRQLLGTSADELRESLSGYVQRVYRADRLGRFSAGDPKDVSTPFMVEVEAVDAKIGYTGRAEAKVQLRSPVLFGFVPDLLRDAALGLSESDATQEQQAAAMLVKTRAADLLLPQAFVAEVRYELAVPEGFEPKRPLEPIRIPLGPGSYEMRTERAPSGAMQVFFRLGTGKRRYTADEARAFVVGLSKVWALEVPEVVLVHAGARHIAQGAPKQGIEVYRRLARARPRHAPHRARYAEALLGLGLGAAARREARAAAELGPDSVPVQMVLGRVLEHDVFGRRLSPGASGEEALAAFRRVLELDPDELAARREVARLLERQAAWGEAAEAYRTLRDRTGDTQYDAHLLLALYWARDFEGLHRLASRLPPNGPNLAMQLVGAAERAGAKAALEELAPLDLAPEVRQEALATAADSLARLRDYPLARALLAAAVRDAAEPAPLAERLEALRRLRRVEASDLDPRTPVGAVRRLLFAMLSPGLDAERVGELFSARAFDERTRGRSLEALAEGLSTFQRAAKKAELPLATVRDDILSLTQLEAEGAPGVGYRVTGRIGRGPSARRSVWFVVKEGGEYRVRASESSPSSLGEEALRLARAGREKAAERWLAWAEALVSTESRPDPLETPPFATLRAAGAPPEVQAAALVATGPRAAHAVAVLSKARRTADGPQVRLAAEHGLMLAFERVQDHEAAARVANRIVRQAPRSDRAFAAHCRTLVEAGEGEAARDLAEARLERRVRDPMALACLSERALAAGDVPEARRWLAKRIELGLSDAITLNNLAWLALFTEDITEADVEMALRSNAMTGFEDPAKLHTLAALYAERGKAQEAFQLFLKRLELRGADEPADVDWYLLGRIMQHYELDDLALEAYRRVPPPAGRTVDSTHRLVEMRIRDLADRAAADAL